MKTKQTTITKKPAKAATETTTKRAAKTEVKAAKPAKTDEVLVSSVKVDEAASAKVIKAVKTAAKKPAKKAEKHARETKGATIQALIERTGGATAAELQKAAGWQAHSVRGFISAVLGKKLGLTVASEKNDAGERVYSIAQK